MEILWNQVNIQPPPYRPWDITTAEFDPKKFIQTIDSILNDFKTFSVLHTEAALLSRLIYRMKSKFRSDKGLKHMEKVNRALLNYLNMSLEREYELLKEYTEINNGIVSLPPRQTLEYVLVRTQGFAKLMCRVESMAMIASNILQSRLYIGQSWSVAMIAFAVMSRIWMLSRYILKRSCVWYDNIYKFAKTFKIVGISWLPENFTLPRKLSKWLDLPWFSENLDKIPLDDYMSGSVLELIKVNGENEPDVNVIDDAIDKALEAKTEEPVISKINSIFKPNCKNVDVGQTISREMFQQIQQQSVVDKSKKEEKQTTKIVEKSVKEEKLKTKALEKAKNKKIKLLRIKSEKDLVRLLTTDNYPGIDKLQWTILKKKIKKLLLKLTKNNTQEVSEKLCKKVAERVEKWMSCR